jgi:hypothetical protein
VTPRPVFICFDSDITTKPRVQAAERRFGAALNKTWRVNPLVVRLPPTENGNKQGADDFLKANGKAAFKKLLRAAKPVDAEQLGGEPVGACVADLQTEAVEYLWYPRLPLRLMTALDGHSSEGKTFVALAIAAAGSRGEEPHDGKKLACGRFSTIYMSKENPVTMTTRPRFLAMGGDPNRLFTLNGIRQPDGTERAVTLNDTDVIETYAKQTGARLLIIDPLQSYIGAGVDLHRSNETRPVLDKLMAMAERLNICVLVIRHLSKGDNGGRAIHRGLGGVDIFAAMRSVLMVGSAPGDREHRALVHLKNNVGPQGEALAYTIEGTKVDGVSTAKVVWGGRSELTAEDLVAVAEKPKTQSKVQRAREALRAALADGEWHLVNDLQATLSEFTARDLREASQGVIERRRQGQRGPVEWRMRPPRKFEGGGAGAAARRRAGPS